MGSPRTPDFTGLLARLTRTLEDGGIPFMLIGGQAVLLHGEPRLTQDIDVTLGVGPGRLDEVLVLCPKMGLTPLPEDVAAFVRGTFLLPARDGSTGIRVDLIFSTTPYEGEAIAHAERVKVGGEDVPFATAEDLIIHKLFAARPRDLEDAAGVVRRKGPELDWAYLERWCEEFAGVPGREGMPALLDELRAEMAS
jgi:predicted nucleotidyltransferase